jgi:chromate reductase, NAD(P)H dehydrogenase (quinone)
MGVDIPLETRMLTVCGSLQHRSANRAALNEASAVAVAAGAGVDDFDRLADVPAFDADRTGEPIAVIDDWRRRTAAADAVLVAAPEYAGAVAGAVKNAFDWLVGGGELYHKPVAVISAGTSGGLHARSMMAQTLTWQGAYVVAELGIASPRTKFDGAGRITDGETATAVASLTHILLAASTMAATELVERATSVVQSLGIDVAHVAPA